MQKMRLCIDGRMRATDATGVASYARALEEALTAHDHAPILLDDSTAGQFGTRSGPFDRIRRWLAATYRRPVMLSVAPGVLRADDIFRLAQVRFARTGELLRLQAPGPPGIMHWTYPIPAHLEGWINLYTVHDVIPLLSPKLSPIDPVALRRRLDAIAAVADQIVAVSGWGRRTIVETLALPEQKVVDCGSAVAQLIAGDGGLPSGLKRDDYFLFCGLIEPRKNIARIVKGWAASGTRRRLVLVGPDGAGGAALRAEYATRPDLLMLPWQPRAALVDLIAGARALVFPTLEEGFGLPVAEAMALGTPVLTSDRGALAETAGGAALLVDPEDADAIGGGIARIDDDDALRVRLRALGLARSEHFTLEAFGRRLLTLYADLAGDSALAS